MPDDPPSPIDQFFIDEPKRLLAECEKRGITLPPAPEEWSDEFNAVSSFAYAEMVKAMRDPNYRFPHGMGSATPSS